MEKVAGDMTSQINNEYFETITHLRKELYNREKDIKQAALFGQQLLEEKNELYSKIETYSSQNEILVQEKHSLQANLDANVHILSTYSSEIEILREKTDKLEKENELLKKDNLTLQIKNKDLLKEINYFKNSVEDLQHENATFKSKINLQNMQLKDYQDQIHQSICEINDEDLMKLQSDLQTCKTENKDLQNLISEMQHKLESAKMNEERLRNIINEMEEEILGRDKEISSYSVEVKKAQDEATELRGEIEVLKFDQIDVNKRGNSVFAELDDRRHKVETLLVSLKEKYKNVKEKYEDSERELRKARNQMATLLSMTSRKTDTAYIQEIENNLFTAKNEITLLTHKLIKQSSNQKECHHCNNETANKAPIKSDNYGFMSVMLEQSRESNETLRKELNALRTQNLVDNDKLLETQRLLYKAKRDLDASRGECLKIKLQLKEVIEQNQDAGETAKYKPNVEYLPGFKPNEQTTEALEKLSKPNDNIKEEYIIPAEVELIEDGFVQMKPSRKSNKWVLRQPNLATELNVIEPKLKKDESILIDPLEQTVSYEAPKDTSSCSKENMQPSNRIRRQKILKHENCAQQ